MDDIVQARKARMKLWNTSSEKVCEVQTVDEAGSSTPKRYTNRRYSDFVGSSLAPIPSSRRASENPNLMPPTLQGTSSAASNFLKKTGIVVSKSDLMSLMSSLTSSATEINKVPDTPVTPKQSSNTLMPEPEGMSRSNRSNSFDVSILHNAKQMISGATSGDKNTAALSGWFEKRHQPMARKKSMRSASNATVSFSKEVLDRFKDKEDNASSSSSSKSGKDSTKKPKSKLRWDNKSSFVDPHVIGNAIEGFLRKSTSSSSKGAVPKDSSRSKKSSTSKTGSSFWFGKGDEDDSTDTCDSSLCSTLKDLFVK